MLFIIFGAVSIIASIVVLIFRNKARNQVMEMKYLKTSKAAELSELHKKLVDEVGGDAVKQLAELKGAGRMVTPLLAEITKTECIGYNFSITENYEEDYETRDDEGRIARNIRKGSNVVASNSRFNYFMLADDTGEVMIDPEGADIDMVKTTEKYEPHSGGVGFLQFGNFTLNINTHPQRRVTGYNIVESILPAGSNLYVIGEMQDNNGSPIIRKPQDRNKPFIISRKSEEEAIKQKENTSTILLVLAVVFAVAGLGLIAWGISSIL